MSNTVISFLLVQAKPELERYSRTLDKDYPEDLFQDTALRILEHPESIPENADEFVWWAKRVMKNIYLNNVRAQKLRETDELDENLDLADTDSDLDYKILKEKVDAELTDLDRDIFWLYVKGYSYKEISDKTGIKLGTVKSRLSKCKDRLKQKISDK